MPPKSHVVAIRTSVVLVLTFFMCSFVLIKDNSRLNVIGDIFEEDEVNELDGCFHIYLDVGTNVGIQVRALLNKVCTFLRNGNKWKCNFTKIYSLQLIINNFFLWCNLVAKVNALEIAVLETE